MRRDRPGSTVRGRRARSLLVSTIGGGALSFACGGDDRQQTPTELYPSRYADAVCAVWEPCCRANGISFDRGKCGLSGAIFVQGGIDQAAKVGATLNPAKADKCIEAAVAATKKCIRVQDDPTARFACAAVWNGPKKVGDACTSDLECASTDTELGVCLKVSGPDQPGVCARKTVTAKVDDVCGKTANGPVPTSVADCDGNDLQCNLQSQKCSGLVPVGGKCGTFNRCEKGAFCSVDVCEAGLAAGATCSEAEAVACTSGLCVQGKCGDNAVGTLVACTGEM